MDNYKIVFFVLVGVAVLAILVFLFASIVGNSSNNGGGSSKNDGGNSNNGGGSKKGTGKNGHLVTSLELYGKSGKNGGQKTMSPSITATANTVTQDSRYQNAYPLENDYVLTQTGALVTIHAIAVTSAGIVFAVDVTNELLYSADSGKTFKRAFLAAKEVTVDSIVDIAYDSTLETLSLLRVELAGTDFIRQRIDTFSVDSLLESSAQFPVKARWQSPAEQPDGTLEIGSTFPTQQLQQSSANALALPRCRYLSIAYDLQGNLYGLFQTALQQTDVYSIDKGTGATAFKGPIDAAIAKLMFDPRRVAGAEAVSYGVTKTLYSIDNELALVSNETGLVKQLSSQQPSSTTKGNFESIAGSPLLLYVVKSNRLYHVTNGAPSTK